jgi:hypothetical protein
MEYDSEGTDKSQPSFLAFALASENVVIPNEAKPK